jgi:hypothetical protein
LTKDRLEIILERWIEFRQVPSPAEVSEEEGIGLLGSRGEKQENVFRLFTFQTLLIS